jgi:subfamily B ATP-binding cassette protein MsbA
VGDTARIKSGLKGFLVHVAPNGMLFLGVTLILCYLNARLGLIFGLAGVGVGVATLLGARGMYRTSKKYRKKEGQVADEIDEAIRGGAVEPAFASVNQSSGTHEAALTRIQSLTTWSVYVLFGLAVLAATWIGTREIAAGTLEPRDMVLFLMYALIIRGPTVRLARQGSRVGKTLATANRVVKVLYREPAADAAVAVADGEAACAPSAPSPPKEELS